MQLISFYIDQQQYALRLSRVQSVIRAAKISALPKAPEIVSGVINIHGVIVPVVNVRRRFNLPERDVEISDHFILAHTARRLVCLVADAVGSVDDYPDHSIEEPSEILPNLDYVSGVVRLPDGVMFIHDLDQFLSLEEENSLERALA